MWQQSSHPIMDLDDDGTVEQADTTIIEEGASLGESTSTFFASEGDVGEADRDQLFEALVSIKNNGIMRGRLALKRKASKFTSRSMMLSSDSLDACTVIDGVPVDVEASLLWSDVEKVVTSTVEKGSEGVFVRFVSAKANWVLGFATMALRSRFLNTVRKIQPRFSITDESEKSTA
eukprot:TRINITY_DN11273_c0_g3_i4.p1 TRINITY_DN11273_c0_g3~~TRINITY_DN11273_c0_g3_i4.p1  ORF type:complete len:176 (+),score=33.16 TRINITY_DN11273_c0_g3_i4:356-883(+)